MAVYDRHDTQNVDCTVFELYLSGVAYWSWPVSSTGGGAGSGVQYLSVSDANYSNLEEPYVWKCVIPPKVGTAISHIAGYYVAL
jgi:hypothetical protein